MLWKCHYFCSYILKQEQVQKKKTLDYRNIVVLTTKYVVIENIVAVKRNLKIVWCHNMTLVVDHPFADEKQKAYSKWISESEGCWQWQITVLGYTVNQLTVQTPCKRSPWSNKHYLIPPCLNPNSHEIVRYIYKSHNSFTILHISNNRLATIQRDGGAPTLTLLRGVNITCMSLTGTLTRSLSAR